MEKGKTDPESRDYKFSDIEPDERFTQTFKEFWITMGVFAVFMVLMIWNLYMVNGYDVSNYTYVFGFPLWIFLEICILIGMVIAVLLVVTFVYKDMDITPHGKIKTRGRK
ncbi:MAG: YhdT family protein [Clostridium sp.]|nr:YhdT family protein [Clostridium sp.]